MTRQASHHHGTVAPQQYRVAITGGDLDDVVWYSGGRRYTVRGGITPQHHGAITFERHTMRNSYAYLHHVSQRDRDGQLTFEIGPPADDRTSRGEGEGMACPHSDLANVTRDIGG